MYKLPVGISRDDKYLTEIELNAPTGRTLKNLRNVLAKGAQGFNPKAYETTLREGVKSIKGISGKPSMDDLLDMTWVDAEYIFMELAKIDLDGENPELSVVCPSCKANTKIVFPFDEVEVVRLDDQDCESLFAKNTTHLIPFELSTPVSFDLEGKENIKKGTLRLLSVRDTLKIFKAKKNKIGSAMMESIYYAIDELGGHTKDDFSIAELENISSRDLKMLERLYNNNIPGVVPPESATCPVCSAPIPVGAVDWVADFLASNLG